MNKVGAQTFSTASRRRSEINIKVSDLYDNLRTNNYTFRAIQE